MAITLYVMQHGEATSEDENPERPLTPGGRAAVERVAARARAGGVRIDRCFHSGKLRAAQTAELLAAAVGGALVQRDGLAPNDPVGPVAAWAREVGETVGLVGHLPFLDRLASLLVADDEGAGVVRFHMGGLVCLSAPASGKPYAVEWALTPELA
jgi:phosphohistidine phosphatase